ncbi:MAG: inorganic phosphate transporter [Nitrospirae bacterium GWF2_44_13]|nr:MAG: inorganic phosphate transporter [Nitrospirae bacterium GWF2_44_13]OGW35611.1 MAG: inorganic phosphate transporter [Nitrospirae bacterium GWD2_44_7]OGW64162.1 MAG: inorganic phosphate transporter [Nitrospirae bacterium RIFOXYA2_FULL_44_9]OGW74477.1 MAG: inorganic phosphate transporter [Nitrospirae bacterium RIFOXYC2_FULL_44_7]HBG92418.1 anion permease [Nitrospiraceae bacterium]
MLEVIILIVILAILFDVSNGWNDSANAIATVVSTRVLSPTKAVLLAGGMNILGAFFTTAVAKTIGKDVVDPKAVTEVVVAAALFSGFAWNTAMTKFGLPVSASHALIGGLIGASVSYGGVGILNASGLVKIFSSLLLSPVLGIILGFFIMKMILKFFGTLPSGTVNKHFGRLQLLSSAFMAFSHGSNDAQKVMGIITLSLVSGGILNSVEVPFWVILICAVAMGLGTAFGGWKVIKTIGVNMLKLEPVHGFAAETSATAIILGASQFGLPVSTTHVIATAIMGVGATKRLSAIRWGIAGKIVLAWVFTLPACSLLAWLICKIAIALK